MACSPEQALFYCIKTFQYNEQHFSDVSQAHHEQKQSIILKA